ncbi:hypothetical protein FRB99_008464 [Tulasnella sp. 403]|nr:hypothetical protein FRB99_008464 [Tulasnella sp. 403]
MNRSRTSDLQGSPLKLETPVGIASLPVEILLDILSRVSPFDILRLRQTCKSLASVTQDPLVWLAILRRSCNPHTLATLRPPIINRPSSDLERLARTYSRSRGVFANGLAKPRLLQSIFSLPETCGDILMLPGAQWLLMFSFSGDISAWDATGQELKFVALVGKAMPVVGSGVSSVQVTFTTQGAGGEWNVIFSRRSDLRHEIHDIFSIDIALTGTPSITLLRTLTSSDHIWPVRIRGTLILWMRTDRSFITVIDWQHPDHLFYVNVTVPGEAPEQWIKAVRLGEGGQLICLRCDAVLVFVLRDWRLAPDLKSISKASHGGPITPDWILPVTSNAVPHPILPSSELVISIFADNAVYRVYRSPSGFYTRWTELGDCPSYLQCLAGVDEEYFNRIELRYFCLCSATAQLRNKDEEDLQYLGIFGVEFPPDTLPRFGYCDEISGTVMVVLRPMYAKGDRVAIVRVV